MRKDYETTGISDPWGSLGKAFNAHKSDIDPRAADNILIGWPAHFEGINKVQALAAWLPLYMPIGGAMERDPPGLEILLAKVEISVILQTEKILSRRSVQIIDES